MRPLAQAPLRRAITRGVGPPEHASPAEIVTHVEKGVLTVGYIRTYTPR